VTVKKLPTLAATAATKTPKSSSATPLPTSKPHIIPPCPKA